MIGRASVGLIAAISAVPSSAQLAITVGAESELRYRSRSISDGNPVANATLVYDDTSGLYAAGSAIADFDPEPGLLAVRGNAGYARRIGRGYSVDVGVMHTRYSDRYSGGSKTGLTEFYAGLSKGRFVGRAYYSPDYLGPGGSTLYGEIEATADLGDDFRLNGHVGMLRYLDTYALNDPTQLDWAIAAAKQFGTSEVHVVLSGGDARADYYDYYDYGYSYPRAGKTALVIGVSHAF